jgi:glycerophosphoryl diester phosphodiesterase
MEILAHRGFWLAPGEKNDLTAFRRAFEHGFGVEIDVRDLDGRLVVSHDPPRSGALPFADVVALHGSIDGAGRLAVNVKSDGLQRPLAETLQRLASGQWFLFDMSVPDAVVCRRQGLPFFTRHSDVESVPALYEDSEGVWLDDFGGGWLREEQVARHLDAGKHVAVVSPELHGRDRHAAWAEWREWGVWSRPGVALCTDHPEEAQEVLGR